LRVRVRTVDRHPQHVTAGGVVHLEAAVGKSERVRAGLAVGGAQPRRVRQELGGGATAVGHLEHLELEGARRLGAARGGVVARAVGDRKSTRLNSSHRTISYAVFCLKKK